MRLTIGILALQGAFAEHDRHLRAMATECSIETSFHCSNAGEHGRVAPTEGDSLDIRPVLIRNRSDWDRALAPPDGENPPLAGLILPGGESTTMGNLLHSLDLFDPIGQALAEGMPVLGTCAGVILLARRIANDPRQHWKVLNVVVERNAYGRQLGSFSAEAEVTGIGRTPLVFIRAPRITEVGANVQVLAHWQGDPVAVQQDNILAVTFHPELSADLRLHRYFVDMCRNWHIEQNRNGRCREMQINGVSSPANATA